MTSAIDIGPKRIDDHTSFRQLRENGSCDIGKLAPVIPQQVTLARIRIGHGRYPSAYKQVEVAVCVKVNSTHTGTATRKLRQRILGQAKSSLAIVEVQPVLVLPRRFRVFHAAADRVKVEIAITIGIKQEESFVFVLFRWVRKRRCHACERPACSLDKQRGAIS